MKKPAILSATFVRNIRQPGRYGDGRGGHGLALLVRVRKNGRVAKYWVQTLRADGKVISLGLGVFPGGDAEGSQRGGAGQSAGGVPGAQSQGEQDSFLRGGGGEGDPVEGQAVEACGKNREDMAGKVGEVRLPGVGFQAG